MATPESEETPDESGQIGVVSETGRHADVMLQNGATQAAVGGVYPKQDGVSEGDDEDDEAFSHGWKPGPRAERAFRKGHPCRTDKDRRFDRGYRHKSPARRFTGGEQ